MIIDLKLNDNLIPQGHFMRYQLPNGTDVVQHFTKTDIDLCHYKVSTSILSINHFLYNLIFFYRGQLETMWNRTWRYLHVMVLKA